MSLLCSILSPGVFPRFTSSTPELLSITVLNEEDVVYEVNLDLNLA